MDYKLVGNALDLFFRGVGIHYNQLSLVQKVTQIPEIVDLEVELSVPRIPVDPRSFGGLKGAVLISGAVRDERILSLSPASPQGTGLMNLLEKYNLSRGVMFGPDTQGKDVSVGWCVGGVIEKYWTQSLHHHVFLSVYSVEEFNSRFQALRDKRNNSIYSFDMHPNGETK